MYYSLADLFRDSPVPEFHLLTRPFDFSGIPILSASFQELPIDDFIGKDELVLSTAAGCAEDKSRYLQMIRIASESCAAAIIYTLRDESYAIPPEAAAYADSVRLPVFWIPWKYRLSDIHAFVVRQIQDKKSQVYRQTQNALLNLFFDSRPLRDAAEQIAAAFGCPAAVADRSGRLKGASRRFRAEDAEGAARREIFINGELAGCLLLRESGDCGELTADPETLEKFVLSPLSLWFYRKNIEDLTVMKLKNNFVWDLANRNYESLEEMARQGAKLHFDLNRPYTCVLMKAAARKSPTPLQEYSSEAAQSAAAIQDAVLSAGQAGNLRVMLADRSMQFIIYVENAAPDPAAAVEQLRSALDARLRTLLPALDFYWGVSETALCAPDFARLYNNAALALQYCLSAKSDRRCFTYRDTKEAQIVSILSDREEILQTARETLGGLLDDTAPSRVDLMGTLAEFIRSNYNTSLTARNLHIHRQSLLYRLERIEALTGMSLSSHKDLFLLEVYSRIFSDY